MLVGLEDGPEHLTSLETGLVDEIVADGQQLRECHFDNLVEICSCLAHLEPVDSANGQQTLQTGKDLSGILGVQKGDGDVEKVGPLFGEVVVEYLLESSDELRSDLRGSSGNDWDDAVANQCLFLVGHGSNARRVVFVGRPSFCDSILEVYNGCGRRRTRSANVVRVPSVTPVDVQCSATARLVRFRLVSFRLRCDGSGLT